MHVPVLAFLSTLLARWLEAAPAIGPVKLQFSLELPPEHLALAVVAVVALVWARRRVR